MTLAGEGATLEGVPVFDVEVCEAKGHTRNVHTLYVSTYLRTPVRGSTGNTAMCVLAP